MGGAPLKGQFETKSFNPPQPLYNDIPEEEDKPQYQEYIREESICTQQYGI